MSWKLVDSGCQTADYIMKKDQEMLSDLLMDSEPILHLYRWKGNCATYGYFIRPFDFLCKEGIEKESLELAQRPTGGGLLFHLTDLAFSILIPAHHKVYSLNTLESYAYINNRVLEVISDFLPIDHNPTLFPSDDNSQCADEKSFCMARPTKYDIMINGKKIGGAAQRRTKKGLLHQGSLFLCPPPETFLKTVLLKDSSVLSAIKENCGSLLLCHLDNNLESMRAKLQDRLKKLFLN